MKGHARYLDEAATAVLASIVMRRRTWGSLTPRQKRAAKDVLMPAGFAARCGDNGMGALAITKRGILKCLAAGLIARHPADGASGTAMLSELRRAKPWGP